MTVLDARGLNKSFGGLKVTSDLDLALAAGELHCLIGPNGAGKSTLFRLIIGEHQPDTGQILFEGADITRMASHDRVRRGMSVKFQVPGVFRALSVRQNLEIALQRHLEGVSLKAEIARLLIFLNLAADAGQSSGNLSHGQKQWLEIGMAISLKPSLLLLDEPTAGMSIEETEATGEMVKLLNADGMTILAIEHDMAFVRQVAQRVTVLHLGRIFAQGNIDQITRDERVAAIYLGQDHAHV